jgi:hypothetical protein
VYKPDVKKVSLHTNNKDKLKHQLLISWHYETQCAKLHTELQAAKEQSKVSQQKPKHAAGTAGRQLASVPLKLSEPGLNSPLHFKTNCEPEGKCKQWKSLYIIAGLLLLSCAAL